MGVYPTGRCYCGCRSRTESYFVPGHDSKALSSLIRRHRNTAGLLAAHGFGPEESVIEPPQVVDDVGLVDGAPEPLETHRVLATLLLTDIVDSTRLATELGDHRWREVLDSLDALVVPQVERFRGRLVKATGDGHLATFDRPGRAIHCALALRDGVRGLGVDVRIGLHTGEVEMRGDDVGGIAVHLAERVSAQAGAGDVVVSRTVVDLVAGSGIEFQDRGAHALKGVAGAWQLYAVQTVTEG
jgi:class 3 adenylate cyclase